MSRREALLAVATIVSLGAISGALYGAAQADERNINTIGACVALYAVPCRIVAVPVFPRVNPTAAEGESADVP